MAISVIDEVHRTKIGSPTDKSVLVALANYASKDGSGVYPCAETIMVDTEFSRSTVFKSLSRLEDKMIIHRVGETPKGVIIYHIDLQALRKLPQRELKKRESDLHIKASDSARESDRQTGKPNKGVREMDSKQSISRTQTVKEPINTITKVEKSVPLKKSRVSSLAPELKSAVELYNAEAKLRNWPPSKGALEADVIARLADCVREAGGIEGWEVAMQRAGSSDFLCGKTRKGFDNNFTYLLKTFDKLLTGGFDNKGTVVQFKPRSSFEKNVQDMGRILRDVAQQFRVEDWKLRGRKFAPQFPDAVDLATKLMQQQGIPEAEIKAFMSPQVAA